MAKAGIGHNSGDAPTPDDTVTVAGDQLRAYVERLESVNQEISDRQTDRKEILAEAKGNGFDAATICRIVATRKKDRDKVAEQDALYDLYTAALGGVFA